MTTQPALETPVQARQMTIDEFERIADTPENMERFLELIDGVIVEKPMPAEDHGVIALNCGTKLNIFIEVNDIEGRASVETRYRPEGDDQNAFIPDLSYRKTTDISLAKGSVPKMPDFAIEIKSPGQGLRAQRERARTFIARGVKLVWLIVPEKRLVEVFSADMEDVFGYDETLTGGDVLPGFQMSVRDVFKNTSVEQKS